MKKMQKQYDDQLETWNTWTERKIMPALEKQGMALQTILLLNDKVDVLVKTVLDQSKAAKEDLVDLRQAEEKELRDALLYSLQELNDSMQNAYNKIKLKDGDMDPYEAQFDQISIK